MIKRNLGLFLVLLITLMLYLPSLFYHFVGDDYVALEKLVTSCKLSQVFSICWPGMLGGYLRPLQWIPYMLGYALAGLPVPPDPLWQSNGFLSAYHLLNVIFHLANVILVYLIASFAFKSRYYGTFAAMIFAVHPTNSEVVCWIAVFGDASAAFFMLLSLMLFGKFYLSAKTPTAYLYYSVSLLSFILALGSKEVAICLPLLIILATLFLEKTQGIKYEIKKRTSWLAYFLLVVLYFIARRLLLPIKDLYWLDFFKRIPYALLKIAYFVRDLIMPVDLDLLKQFVYEHSLLPIAVVFTLFLLVLLSYFIITRARRYPVMLFSFLWIALTLIIPAAIPFAPMRRHLYLPLVGSSILMVSLATASKKKIVAVILGLFIILEIWTSIERNNLYKFSGNLVQSMLFNLKKDLPSIDSKSVFYLVGIPGTIKNTPVLWGAPEAKMHFIYQNPNLQVFGLSVLAFSQSNIKASDITFFDRFSFVESIASSSEEFIRVVGDNLSEPDGKWLRHPRAPTEFKILKRDKFGHVTRATFRIDPAAIKAGKAYLVGFKEGRLQVLESFK